MNAVRSLQTTFRRNRLPVPVIPDSLRPHFDDQRDWVWGTQPDDPRLYDINANVEASLVRPTESVVIGHDGYGTNSWFLHYYLNHGPLSVFIQTPWGGAYTDAKQAAATIKQQYDTLAHLVRASEEASLAAKALPGRLIIQQGVTEPPRWGWVKPGEPIAWNEENEDALSPALQALRA